MAVGRRESIAECTCYNCDLESINSLSEHWKMNHCINVFNSCKRIRKLFKNGYQCVATGYQCACVGYSDMNIISEEELHSDGIVSSKQLKRFLYHTLMLRHPKKGIISTEMTSFARHRYSIGIGNMYQSHGFFVADNSCIAFLKFKLKKGLLHCYYVSFATLDVKNVKIPITFSDPELCSIYLRNGTLWIIQNAEVGVINVALVLFKMDPVKIINRNFGTMDYWNPNQGRINFTEFELEHDFLHVMLNSKQTKLIRRPISTLKNGFLLPLGKTLAIITFDSISQFILFDFYYIEDNRNKLITTFQWNGKFEKKYFATSVSDEAKKAIVRINANDTLVLDFINCKVTQLLPLHEGYEQNEDITFTFSPNGNRMLILGQRKNNPDEYFWTQHVLHGAGTLKALAVRKLREILNFAQLKELNIPRTLRRELTFGRF